MTRVAIVDDHRAFGERLRAFIDEQPGCSVVGIAEDASTGLEEIRTTEPDIALIDIGLPDQNGFWLAERMSELQMEARVVLMSEGEPAEYTEAARSIGASMYLPKSGISQRLPAILGVESPSSDGNAPDKEQEPVEPANANPASNTGALAIAVESPVMPFKHIELITAALAVVMFLGFALSGQSNLGLMASLCLLIFSYRQYALFRGKRGPAKERELRRGRPR